MMRDSWDSKLLVVAKTYPLPSRESLDTVCTAAITEDGQFVRIYPVPFRYLNRDEQFGKYQWIRVALEPSAIDNRPESFQPVKNSKIELLSEPISDWQERSRWVLNCPINTMCELENQEPQTRTLGLIRPKEVRKVFFVPTGQRWKESWQMLYDQLSLFPTTRRPLEKIPFRFVFSYICEYPKCRGHQMGIDDWEVGMRFRNVRDSHDEKTAVRDVKERLTTICSERHKTHFFVGTMIRWKNWTIIGLFYPPYQQRDFMLDLGI